MSQVLILWHLLEQLLVLRSLVLMLLQHRLLLDNETLQLLNLLGKALDAL